MKPRVRPITSFALIVLLPLLSGCGGMYLMPTPNLYADGLKDPFHQVPAELQNNKAEVFYLTDRKEEQESTLTNRVYGSGRSRSVVFGVATMEIGENVSWDELVKASKTSKRANKLLLRLIEARELVRFAPTPKSIAELPPPGATMPTTNSLPALKVEVEAEKEQAKQELATRLAKCQIKDVYVFVHGYNNNFYDSIMTIGQLWHFMGRQGVPVAYSWPAGRGGLLRGYTYDRESSEFTIYHFKEALRMIAQVPEVHRIHVIAHSRGTDVAASALRELNLEFTAGGRSTREVLKLGSVILAAPDLDFEVIMQRDADGAVGFLPEQFALYFSEKDSALGLSNWLFSGSNRLGKLRSDVFTPAELESIRKVKTAQIIDARISDPGPHGHSYFHANPAVSSDVILIMRYRQLPGPERPLRVDPEGFWYIDDKYPRPKSPAPDEAEGRAQEHK